MVLRAILIAILFTVLPFGQVANAVPPPGVPPGGGPGGGGPPLPQVLITSVFVNFIDETIIINGQNFDGGSPVVTLGDDPTPLMPVSATATEIVVDCPLDGGVPTCMDGDFLLTVSTGPAGKDFDAYDLTIGAVGPQGEKGDKGDKGDQGIQGIQGLKGDKGDQGIQGIQGLKGDKGDQGIQGIQGLKGDKGDQGIQGLKGDKGDKGDQGDKGDSGVPHNHVITRTTTTSAQATIIPASGVKVGIPSPACPAGFDVTGCGYQSQTTGCHLFTVANIPNGNGCVAEVVNNCNANKGFVTIAFCARVD